MSVVGVQVRLLGAAAIACGETCRVTRVLRALSFLIRKLTYSLVPQTTMAITATDRVAIGRLATTRPKCCSLSATHAAMAVEYEYAIAK
jgi:hypothetical protein